MNDPLHRLTRLKEKGYIEVDLMLLEFMTRYADTPIKWDIVTFFAANPFSRDVARNLAGRIGRRETAVARELEDLALLGLLQRSRLGDTTVYYLSEKPELREMLTRFDAASRHAEETGRP